MNHSLITRAIIPAIAAVRRAWVGSRQAGFTLIELLVAIAIIGVLAGLLMTNFINVRQRAEDTRKKNNVSQMKRALRLYYNDYQTYPAATSGNAIAGCGADGDATCSTSFSAGSEPTVYMRELPDATEYEYHSNGDETYLLVTTLENASDESAAASQTRCSAEITEYSFSASSNHFVVCQD